MTITSSIIKLNLLSTFPQSHVIFVWATSSSPLLHLLLTHADVIASSAFVTLWINAGPPIYRVNSVRADIRSSIALRENITLLVKIAVVIILPHPRMVQSPPGLNGHDPYYPLHSVNSLIKLNNNKNDIIGSMLKRLEEPPIN